MTFVLQASSWDTQTHFWPFLNFSTRFHTHTLSFYFSALSCLRVRHWSSLLLLRSSDLGGVLGSCHSRFDPDTCEWFYYGVRDTDLRCAFCGRQWSILGEANDIPLGYQNRPPDVYQGDVICYHSGFGRGCVEIIEYFWIDPGTHLLAILKMPLN